MQEGACEQLRCGLKLSGLSLIRGGCVCVCTGEVVNDDSGYTSSVCCSACLTGDCNLTIMLLVFQEKQRQNMLGVTSEQRSLFAAQQINQFQGKEGNGVL